MDTKVNYTLVGLFVIGLSIALILGFFWLSTLTHHKSFQTYLVYVSGGVMGLNIQSPVQYNGVRVGYVEKIELDKINPQLVEIYLKIEEGTPITESTVATLVPQGITGLVYVGLQTESAQALPLKPAPGQNYAVIPYKKPFLLQITEVIPEITNSFKEIAARFNKTFSNENIESFSKILLHLERTTQVLDQESATIRSSIHSLNSFLKNSEKASRQFPDVMTSIKGAGVQLNTSGQKVNSVMDEVSGQVIPSLEELLMRLNSTTDNLKTLSEDLERNPAILLRGKKPPPKDRENNDEKNNGNGCRSNIFANRMRN